MRYVYSITRFWRFYLLLIFGSLLMTYMIYIGKTDPYLQNSFPYFRLDKKLKFTENDADKIKELMSKNTLDYEFVNTNAMLCNAYNTLNLVEDFLLFNDEKSNDQDKLNGLFRKSSKLDILFLSISQAVNFRERSAVRQTWGKYLNKINAKVIFFVGNPYFHEQEQEILKAHNDDINKGNRRRVLDATTNDKHEFKYSDNAKLEKEKIDFNDIIQINMPDNQNYTVTKTLMALRWTLSYCHMARNLFVISDQAILNYNLFEDYLLRRQNFLRHELTDSSLLGLCDLSDGNFAFALKLFFSNLYEASKLNQVQNGIQIDPALLFINNLNIQQPTPESQSLPQTTSQIKKLQSKNLTKRSFKRDVESSMTNKTQSAKYKGQYCSSLGFMVTLEGAKKLWEAALRTQYIMRISPAYLSGYLAFKANLKQVNLFKYYESVPPKTNCLKIFQTSPDLLLCAENFTQNNRFFNYIATWNSPAQSQFGLSKLK